MIKNTNVELNDNSRLKTQEKEWWQVEIDLIEVHIFHSYLNQLETED